MTDPVVSKSQENDEPVLGLIWYWFHFSLRVIEEDTFESTMNMAAYKMDDDCAFDCVEIWDNVGYRKIGHDEVFEWQNKMARERAVERALLPPNPPTVAAIYLTGPTGETAEVERFKDMEKAQREFALYAPMGDRAELRTPPFGKKRL